MWEVRVVEWGLGCTAWGGDGCEVAADRRQERKSTSKPLLTAMERVRRVIELAGIRA